ncbi:hypothetical protein GEMRC1_006733 [Eukaryota sp. GEM-RC1]
MTKRSKKPPSLVRLIQDSAACLPFVDISYSPTDSLELPYLTLFFDFLTSTNLNYSQKPNFFYPCLHFSINSDKLESLNVEPPSTLTLVFIPFSNLETLISSPNDASVDLLSFIRSSFPDSSIRFISYGKPSRSFLLSSLSAFSSSLLLQNSFLNFFTKNPDTVSNFIISALTSYSHQFFRSFGTFPFAESVEGSNVREICDKYSDSSATSILARMLARVPRITVAGVEAILAQFPTIADVFLAFSLYDTNDEKIEVIANIPMGQRTIGPSLSTKIGNLFATLSDS